MLRIQNLSGFGSGRPPSSSTLDKPSEPDHAYSFYDYERVSGLLKLTDIIGSVDLYANADLFDGVFVGSTVGGKRDDQLQVQRASRLIENSLALYGMGADWTATLWFNLKDDAATSATFEIIRIRTSSPGYEVAINARRIDTGDNVGQYEVYSVVNGTEQTILNVSPNAYHFCALRADSGTISVDINSTNAEVTASAGGATQIDYLFLSSESQFDASTSSINFDELYIWTGATLTDGNIAYIFNAGIGRFVDRLTGQWEGTVQITNPDHAWIVGADLNADAVGAYDLIELGTLPNGSHALSGASAKFVRGAGTALSSVGSDDLAGSSDELSVSTWIHTADMISPATGHAVSVYPFAIVHHATGSSAQYLRFLLSRSNPGAYIYIYAAGSTLVDTVSAGSWLHFAVFASGATAKYYFNGSLVLTETPTHELTAARNVQIHSAVIDVSSDTGSPSVIADELYYWNAALSGVEVAALYNQGRGKFVGSNGRFN